MAVDIGIGVGVINIFEEFRLDTFTEIFENKHSSLVIGKWIQMNFELTFKVYKTTPCVTNKIMM